jgi:hypothetical protein
MKIDTYPVGALADLLGAWRYLTGKNGDGGSAEQPPWSWRIEQARYCLSRIRRTAVRHVRARQWRELKNTFNGYLCEPTPLPDGLCRCGSGWTRRRARRSLDRHLASVATGSKPPLDA